jgi:hypothetical protein
VKGPHTTCGLGLDKVTAAKSEVWGTIAPHGLHNIVTQL